MKFFSQILLRPLLTLSLIVLSLLTISAPSHAQYTGPVDTTKAPAPVYSIKNVKISVQGFDHQDNAVLDIPHQFRGAQPLPDSLRIPEEKHLKNIRQLSFDGENAEAYLSPDGIHVSFQARGPEAGSCDQIYTMTLDGRDVKRISDGKGRTTCSYYLPSGDKILYASTKGALGGSCPPEPDFSKGYVWPLYPYFDIYVADTSGKEIGRLTQNENFYDAEATVSPVGDKIIFTSTRSGDIDLYSMNLDGTNVTQLTNEEGYDGGAFYSQDGKQIVYRASRPAGDELKEYRELLKQGLIKPHMLEIFLMDADGSHKRQLTHSNAASFAPYFYPDGKRVIFASNMADPKGRDFDLYMIHTDGTGLERITYNKTFDGFPVFTKDGKHLIFCSNRNGANPHNTNIFIADWVE
ncbi:MAG: hypothetical protein ABI444_02275 [Candidatus Kapaibacterium sp.]|jgi:TolB protein